MATPFFGKRENETPTTARPGSANAYASTGVSSTLNSASQTASPSSAAKPVGEASTTAGSGKEGGSKLTVGPNIKLKGVEITDCDTLVVEGFVEATMDSRVIQISEQGSFKGSAEIDVAEIRGEFDGNLTVRDKLVIYSTGKVTGTIRYGKLVVEEGGQISGEIMFGTSGNAKPASVNKLGLQAA
ncbi:polymer-forming cytoskeletal protein [Polaromonas sp.]|jgi:cytoskeletal protein CcmA (bactofilin family)|uniref:bactofilin family protein n=1 Tax=Polaromonas sp. TaxID=1869339 RepID=UPI001DBB0D87|nr:polymer-forming cytoskeletal protein [Polaromonas sp.]MBT9475071.1 polymer-forming cytoskeletal protein [Polaromonas sp.]